MGIEGQAPVQKSGGHAQTGGPQEGGKPKASEKELAEIPPADSEEAAKVSKEHGGKLSEEDYEGLDEKLKKMFNKDGDSWVLDPRVLRDIKKDHAENGVQDPEPLPTP